MHASHLCRYLLDSPSVRQNVDAVGMLAEHISRRAHQSPHNHTVALTLTPAVHQQVAAPPGVAGAEPAPSAGGAGAVKRGDPVLPAVGDGTFWWDF